MIPPSAVKALRAVLDPATVVLPVGGISLANMKAYRDAGANGFGIGSSLYKPGMSAQDVGEAARRWVDAWRASSPASG
jgi:2-dehydro-3-deoxyphosphogalactonate aldolase